MRKYLLPSALILTLAFGYAVAQNLTKSLQQSQSPGQFGIDTGLSAYFPAHINSLGKTPSVSAGATVSGSDFSGTITESSNSIGEVLTFQTAFFIAPHCVVSERVPTAALATPITYSTVTTSLSIVHLSQASKAIDYFCAGGS